MRRAVLFALTLTACSGPSPVKPLLRRATVRVGALDGRPILAERAGEVATLDDGTPVLLRNGSSWQPADGVPGTRITLDDGRFWAAVRFSDGATQPASHWVAPAHTREELSSRMAQLQAELAHLSPTLAARIEPELPVMALVSATEGDFADPASHPGDTMASIGIFQWAAERNAKQAKGSSLSRFFVMLKRRALRKEDPLFVKAWKQCTKRGFDVRGGNFRLRHKRATPSQVVARLADAFGEGALRTYQLVAAADWIDQIRQAVVRPGFRGGALLAHGYAEAEGGKMVRFDVAGRAWRVRAHEHLTVGDLLHTPAALATAVSLGVNRPHYVETALWQALVPTDALGKVELLLNEHREDELRQLLWPRLDPSINEASLVTSFREHALDLYRPEDRPRRARRLVAAMLL